MKAATLERIALFLIEEGGADTCARCTRAVRCRGDVSADVCLRGMAEHEERGTEKAPLRATRQNFSGKTGK